MFALGKIFGIDQLPGASARRATALELNDLDLEPFDRWMSEVDVALNDEGQQYGNLDKASAIARVPRKGLVVWCGDHKQTPGGLRKSDEARAFRRKLMRRPIALRGDTKFIPPHMLGAIVHPYVQDVPGLQVAGLSQLLHESTRQPLGLSTGSVAVFQELM